jgi:hypothetical protein
MKKKPGLSAGESLGKGKVGTEELSGRGKGDSLKIELVAELRKQTVMSMGWIAKELNAGAPKSIWNGMRRLHEKARWKKRVKCEYLGLNILE